MSLGLDYLHSHSWLEREMKIEKRFVLVDTMFADLFLNDAVKKRTVQRKVYLRVPTLSFVRKGGIFKNLDS